MKRVLIFSIFSIVCLLLTSCGSKRHTAHAETHVSETVQMAISEEITEISQSETIETVAMQRDVSTEIDETVVKTVWSPPDDAGQQFPTATIQVHRTTRAQEHDASTSLSNRIEQSETVETRQDSSIIETARSDLESTETITEANAPLRSTRQRFRMWIGGVALTLIVGFGVYKVVKHKLLKRK